MTDSNYTHIAVVADRSGSMANTQNDMNQGLKTFLEEQGKEPGKLRVDVVTFDTKIEHVHQGVEVSDISHPIIFPRGGTALNDALGRTIADLGERFRALPEDQRPGKVIVMTVTDGEENSSREYTRQVVQKLIETQTNEFGWTFLFLGANIDAQEVASGYGILRGHAIDYAETHDGVANMAFAASAAVTRTRSGLSTAFTDEERAATMANVATPSTN